jgi:trehalose 2-sulfotransferase
VSSYDTLDQDLDSGAEAGLSYLICSTPRSGSYLLCELLWRTGAAGAPEEFFHPDFMPRLMRRWGVDSLDAYIAALLEHKTSPNGVFGAKIHWGQYSPVLGERDITTLFPNTRFIHISRSDRVRQAVSWVRAMQTLRWKSSEQDRREVAYDAEDIAAKLRRIEGDEERWRALFERYGIEPHEVVYEQLSERPGEVVRGVLDWAGIEAPGAAPDEPGLRRQADSISEQWVQRFLDEQPAASS